MSCFGYEDLNASFSFESPIFGGESNIDNLCQTYLGSMESFADSYHHNTYPHQTESGSGLLAEIETFDRTDIYNWRPEDCFDWAGSVCRRRGIDQTTVDINLFIRYTGSELLQFTSQDFCNLIGSIYGPIFYTEFVELQNKRCQADSHLGAVGGVGDSFGTSSSLSPYASYGYPYERDALDLTSEDIQDLDRYIHHPDYEPVVDSLGDMELQEEFIKIEHDPLIPEHEPLIPETVSQASYDLSGSSQDQGQKPRKEVKKSRGPKNWQFVVSLLVDPKANPSLIRWEDQSQATFRLVQPTTIAKIWGQRTNKPNLTYDNFARGLRYHYTTGALKAVSEKQLVYKCGPKAIKFLIDLKQGGSAASS